MKLRFSRNVMRKLGFNDLKQSFKVEPDKIETGKHVDNDRFKNVIYSVEDAALARVFDI